MRLDLFLKDVLAEGEYIKVYHDGHTYSLFSEECPPKQAFNFLKTRFQEKTNGQEE